MRQEDNAEWILRTVRRILRESGPKTARRFIESRGGTAKWQTAAQEIARHALREQSTSTPGTKHGSHLYSIHHMGWCVDRDHGEQMRFFRTKVR